MGRRVLVTGGAGFIGSHIADTLVRDGHEVAVVDNLSSGKREQVPPEARFFELDITAGVDAALEAFRPDAVFHEAAQISVSASMKQPEFDARVNVLGSIHLLETCRRSGVKKLIYASSAAAYGPLETLPLREAMRPMPLSCYGISKYAVEHYLRAASSQWGLEWAALRYSNVYGPRQDPHGEAGVVAIFSQQILEGKAPTIFGGGELTRDYIFVADVVSANLAALETDLRGHPDPVFNVSTGVPTTTNRIFELVRKGLRSTVEAVRGPDRPGDVRHSLLDSAKFRALTGWSPRTSVEDGLPRTTDFFAERARPR
ncbi:MAG: NAD-dependent epimerase/dehydratase family protein [Planctomycetes bacterium]|nr:NAD-dependent epimerase/dehydratase family protein [Planctomycetota bacterium]